MKWLVSLCRESPESSSRLARQVVHQASTVPARLQASSTRVLVWSVPREDTFHQITLGPKAKAKTEPGGRPSRLLRISAPFLRPFSPPCPPSSSQLQYVGACRRHVRVWSADALGTDTMLSRPESAARTTGPYPDPTSRAAVWRPADASHCTWAHMNRESPSSGGHSGT
jgi:hypothetical protein